MRTKPRIFFGRDKTLLFAVGSPAGCADGPALVAGALGTAGTSGLGSAPKEHEVEEKL